MITNEAMVVNCGAPRAEPVAPFRDPWGGILSEAHGQRPWPESKGRGDWRSGQLALGKYKGIKINTLKEYLKFL
jgi:hypothetical protein